MIIRNKRTGILQRIILVTAISVASIASQAYADELFRFAGDGTAGFGGDGNPAEDAQLNLPHAVVVDSAGNTYIADYENHRVRRVDVNGDITTFAGDGTQAMPEENDPLGTWNFGDGGPATAAQLNSPIHLALDSDDQLYILDFWNHRVRMVDTDGVITTVAGSPTGVNGYNGDNRNAVGATLNRPWGIFVDAARNLYIADRLNHVIRKVPLDQNDPNVGIITTVAGTATVQGNAAADPTGVFGDGGPATAALLNNPHDVEVDAAGNMYIADTFNHRIRMVDTNGTITTVAAAAGSPAGFNDGPAANARFRQPRRLAFTAAGDLYIADANGERIRVLDTGGNVSTVAGTGIPGFTGDGQAALASALDSPNDVFAAASGDIFVADTFNHRVRVISADSANAPPTDISLSNDTIDSTDGVNALVGTLTTVDADGGDVHVYSLIAGTGDTDNDLFTISGDQLTANDATAMSAGQYSVLIRSDDQVDASFAEAFVINVTSEFPTITILGDNPATVFQGDAYVDAGATVVDNVDDPADLTIDVTNNVDTSMVGDYTVVYTVTDSDDNTSTATRNVTVASNTAPTITIAGDNPATVLQGEDYEDAGATASDVEDGDLTNEMTTIENVDTSSPGNYTVVYRVTDSDSNTVSETRNVTVTADTAPQITILGDNPVTVTEGTAYTDAGATASDAEDGDLTAQIMTTDNVDTSSPGDYTVVYEVTDSNNNTTTVTRNVTVQAAPAPPPTPTPAPSGGGGGSMGLMSIFALGCLALRRRVRRVLA
jgi:hypothetical protein